MSLSAISWHFDLAIDPRTLIMVIAARLEPLTGAERAECIRPI